MSVTKHKIFKVKISQDSKFSLDETTQKEINKFLSESDNIYVNHSTSVLTEDIEEYGQNKTINKFLVISLIYKDLTDTSLSLKNTSKKIRNIVSKELETGEIVKEPNIETEFDKEIKGIMDKWSSVKEEDDLISSKPSNKNKSRTRLME